jgi:S-formylglutathione hydrolase FrmB
VNATREPYSTHYQMYTYVTEELPALLQKEFSIGKTRSISGHSMGGHGALTIAIKNPSDWVSVSAFSPICNRKLNCVLCAKDDSLLSNSFLHCKSSP